MPGGAPVRRQQGGGLRAAAKGLQGGAKGGFETRGRRQRAGCGQLEPGLEFEPAALVQVGRQSRLAEHPAADHEVEGLQVERDPGMGFEPFLQMADQFGQPAVHDGREFRQRMRAVEEVVGALVVLGRLDAAVALVGHGPGEEVAADGVIAGKHALAGQQQHHHRALRADLDQDGVGGARSRGAKGCQEPVGWRRDLADVLGLESQAADLLADVAFLAERNPVLLPVGRGRGDLDEVVDDGALADAAQALGLLRDEPADFALRRGGQIDQLRSGQVLRQGQGHWRAAPLGDCRVQMGGDFVGRHKALGLEVEGLLAQDAQAPQATFHQRQLQAAAAGVHHQHAAQGRLEASELGHDRGRHAIAWARWGFPARRPGTRRNRRRSWR